MNRSGILDALASLLASVGIELPPWGMPVVALAVAATHFVSHPLWPLP